MKNVPPEESHNSFQLSSRDRKTRKRWLILTFVNSLLFPVIGLLTLIFIPLTTPIQIAGVVTIILGVSWLLLLYYCCYKKPGTTLLTFALIMSGISILLTIFKGGNIAGYILLIPTVWWFVLSLKLRKINKEAQLQIFKGTQLYLEVEESFKSASDRDDLEDRYGSFVRSHSAPLPLKLIYKEYASRMPKRDES